MGPREGTGTRRTPLGRSPVRSYYLKNLRFGTRTKEDTDEVETVWHGLCT